MVGMPCLVICDFSSVLIEIVKNNSYYLLFNPLITLVVHYVWVLIICNTRSQKYVTDILG
jgi:hypothetical protein